MLPLLPEKLTDIGPIEIQDHWIARGEDFEECVQELVRRQYALLEIRCSIGLVQLWGFWSGDKGGSFLVSPENNICLEMLQCFQWDLRLSGPGYRLFDILNEPNQHSETVLVMAVETVQHTFLTWCANECTFGNTELFFSETGSKDSDHMELKQHRVGKFHRRKKHSLLKRKKRQRLRIGEVKKKKKTIKARVHRKYRKTYMSF